MARTRRNTALIGFAVLLAVAGCGSTVPSGSANRSFGGLPYDGSTSQPSTGAPLATQTGDATGTAVRARAGSATVSSSGNRAISSLTAVPPTPGSCATIARKGKGWDEKYVYLGILTFKDAETVLGSAGIPLSTGDQAGAAQSTVDALNREGGLLCRKVKLVVHDSSTAEMARDPQTWGEASCTYFTQDAPVISVIAIVDVDSLRACLAKHHTIDLSTNNSVWDDQVAQQYAPYFYNSGFPSLSHLIPAFMKRLQAQQWFTGWDPIGNKPSPGAKVRVGVTYGSDVTASRWGPRLVEMIKKAGYDAEGYQLSSGFSNSDASAVTLKFQSDGVTHVTSVDGSLDFFAIGAKSQKYRPRLALQSYVAPQSFFAEAGAASPDQLRGAVGMGWYPPIDVNDQHDPGMLGGQRWCYAALKAGHHDFPSRFSRAVGLGVCDGVRLPIYAARAGGGIDPEHIRAGIVKIGPTYPVSGGGLEYSGLSETNFALPGGARDLQWDEAGQCFVYRGRSYRF